MLRRQRADQFVEVAVHDHVDLVQRQIDPVVGHAALRKVVGADAVAAVARADQVAPRGGFLRLRRAQLHVLQTRRQHLHRLVLVAVLAAVVLAFDDDAGRQVGQPHRRIGLVDVLAAGARGAEGVDAQIAGIDFDLAELVGLGHYRDRAGRGMDAPLRLGGRHALHAMAARFELQLRERGIAGDAHDHFLVAAQIRRRLAHDLDLPALPLGIARVHAQQIAGEQRAFLAAGAGADFQDQVAVVVGVLRQQQRLQAGLQFFELRARGIDLVAGKGLHLRVVEQRLRGGQIVLGLPVMRILLGHGRQLGMLARQLAVLLHVRGRVFAREQGVDFVEALGQLVELGLHAGFHRNPGWRSSGGVFGRRPGAACWC